MMTYCLISFEVHYNVFHNISLVKRHFDAIHVVTIPTHVEVVKTHALLVWNTEINQWTTAHNLQTKADFMTYTFVS